MEPTRQQAAVMDRCLHTDKPVAWLGTIRGGKTTGAVMLLLQQAMKVPGIYLACAYTYGNIDRTILPTLMEVMNGFEEPPEHKLRKTFPYKMDIGESTIYFVSGSDEASFKAIQGMTVTGAVVDECLLMPKSFLMQLVARMSKADPWLLLTANKEAPNHWLKREWIDTGAVYLMESGLDKNPHISEKTRSWYDNLITGNFKTRMLGNEWAGSGNSICKAELVYKCDRKKGELLCRFQDNSDQSHTILASYCRSTFTLSVTPVEEDHGLKLREISNFCVNKLRHKLDYADLAVYMSSLQIVSDSEYLVDELNSLTWMERGKTCHFPPMVVAVGMAAEFFAKGGHMPIAKPEFL